MIQDYMRSAMRQARYRNIALLATLLWASTTAHGAIKTETVPYKDGDTVLKGFIAYDDAVKEKRPCVMLVHEWWGLGDFVKGKAKDLAEAGYVAFAVDMYGDGFYTDTASEAAARSGEMKKNPDKAKARFGAALATVRARSEVDPAKIAAIGFCFGGTMVLDMARMGVDLRAVVSFHGGLSTSVPASDFTPIPAILVCHGNDDPFVSKDEVAAFKEEMTKRKVALNFIGYPDTVHSFTNPEADKRGMDGAKYNKAAAEHSWDEMKTFLKKAFAK